MATISAVTKTKFLGADFGFSVIVPVMKERITTNLLPNVGVGTYGVSGISCLLNWVGTDPKQISCSPTGSAGLCAPTGNYSSDQFFNTGLGMWTNQFQLGTTFYPDKTKKWNASLLSSWEINGTKSGTSIKPGPGMTLEYGFGRRMLHYTLNLGVAGSYYRKLALDSGTQVAFHDQENSIGPEVSYLIPSAHIAFDVRYERQFEVRGRTSGQIVFFSLSYIGVEH
jgi:hypothetical protein